MKKLVPLACAGLLGLAVLATAAACGRGESPATEPASFQECLSQQGIVLPSNRGGFPNGRPTAFPSGRPGGFASGRPTAFPSGRPGGGGSAGPDGGVFGGQAPAGVDPQAWAAALEKCASLRPSNQPSGRPGGGPGGDGREAAYRNCLADKTGMTPEEAAKACEVLSPSPR